MAKTWQQVVDSPGYQALPPEERQAARDQYFEQVVAPQVPHSDIGIARQQFHDFANQLEPAGKQKTPEGIVDRLKMYAGQERAQAEKSRFGRLSTLPHIALGAGETAISGLSGLAGQVAGGIRGLGETGLSAVGLSDKSGQQIAQDIRQTEQAMTYEPRTAMGKFGQTMLGAPLELATKYGGKVGGAIGGAVGGQEGRDIGSSIGETAPQVAAALLPLKGAGIAKAEGALPKAADVQVAGEHYTPLRQFSPEERQRFARQREAGMQPTLGSITRQPEQVRFEEQMAKQATEPGRAMHEREKQNQQAAIKAIRRVDKSLTKKTGMKAKAPDEIQAGESIQQALQKKAEADKKNVNALYEKAKASGETNMVMPTKELDKWLHDNSSMEGTVPAIGAIRNEVARLKKQSNGNLTLGDMELIYKKAGQLTQPGTPSMKFMGDVKRTIDQMTQGHGGDLYRAARQARRAWAKKYDDRKTVSDLIGNKAGYREDPKVAGEQVYQKLMTSKTTSLKDLKHVGETLMGGDLKTHPEGPQAFRELQSRTIKNLLDKSMAGTAEAPRLSYAALKRQIDTIGRDKLQYVLGKKALAKIEDTARALEETQVIPGKISGSPTELNRLARENMEKAQNLAMETAKEHALSLVLEGLPIKMRIAARAAIGITKAGRKANLKAEQEKALSQATEEALTPTKASLADIEKEAAPQRQRARQYKLREARAKRRVKGAYGAGLSYAARTSQEQNQ